MSDGRVDAMSFDDELFLERWSESVLEALGDEIPERSVVLRRGGSHRQARERRIAIHVLRRVMGCGATSAGAMVGLGSGGASGAYRKHMLAHEIASLRPWGSRRAVAEAKSCDHWSSVFVEVMAEDLWDIACHLKKLAE